MTIDILCDCCAGTTTHHDVRCPREGLRKYQAKDKPKCPTCLKNNLRTNVLDNFECGSCHTQFERMNEAGPYGALITLPVGFVRVKVVQEPGIGLFVQDAMEKNLIAQIAACRMAYLVRNRIVQTHA